MAKIIYLLLYLSCGALYASSKDEVLLSALSETEIITQISKRTCSICLNPFGEDGLVMTSCVPIQQPEDEEQQNETYQNLHIFHEHCIGKWLDKKDECPSSCPICRKIITKDDFHQSVVEKNINSECTKQQIINASAAAGIITVFFLIKYL